MCQGASIDVSVGSGFLKTLRALVSTTLCGRLAQSSSVFERIGQGDDVCRQLERQMAWPSGERLTGGAVGFSFAGGRLQEKPARRCSVVSRIAQRERRAGDLSLILRDVGPPPPPSSARLKKWKSSASRSSRAQHRDGEIRQRNAGLSVDRTGDHAPARIRGPRISRWEGPEPRQAARLGWRRLRRLAASIGAAARIRPGSQRSEVSASLSASTSNPGAPGASATAIANASATSHCGLRAKRAMSVVRSPCE